MRGIWIFDDYWTAVNTQNYWVLNFFHRPVF
jgi:hypothetical protein